jgi:hypothetical protein
VDKIPLTAATMLTELAPAVLSISKSKVVPCTAFKAAPNKVPVGSVIAVAEAEVEVI